MGKLISNTIAVLIFTLIIFVGIYAVMSMCEFVPAFKLVWDHAKYLEEGSIIYNKELYQYLDWVKNILFFFIPIGFALFVAPWGQSDAIVWKIVSLVGLGLMVIPSFIFHIQLMNFEPIPNAGVGFSDMTEPDTGLFFLFPLSCLYATISFHTIGYNQFLNDWDTFKTNIMAYLYVLGGGMIVMLIFSGLFGVDGFATLTLIIGCISLIVMGVSRYKNGSPFEY